MEVPRFCHATSYAGVHNTTFDFICQMIFSEVEMSEYCRSVIRQRMADGLIPHGQLFEDVEKVTASELGPVDGYVAGYPCQARFCPCQVRTTKPIPNQSQPSMPVLLAVPFTSRRTIGFGGPKVRVGGTHLEALG